MRWAWQWRHTGRDSVSNLQPHDCFPNRLFRRRSKKTSNLRVTFLCAGNSPGTVIASNAENVSIWWRHHGKTSRFRGTSERKQTDDINYISPRSVRICCANGCLLGYFSGMMIIISRLECIMIAMTDATSVPNSLFNITETMCQLFDWKRIYSNTIDISKWKVNGRSFSDAIECGTMHAYPYMHTMYAFVYTNAEMKRMLMHCTGM